MDINSLGAEESCSQVKKKKQTNKQIDIYNVDIWSFVPAVFLYNYECCDSTPPVPPLGQYYQEFWQATPAELHFLKLNIRTCTILHSNDPSHCQEIEL